MSAKALICFGIETILILAFILAIPAYIDAERKKKSSAIPGAVIDLCGISIVALPFIYLVIEWKIMKGTAASQVIAVVAIAAYAILMVMDIIYCIRAYIKNKKARKERKKRK